ncbi:MAG TPA: hypothetical protein VMU77_05305 [Acidimicrobiales bacterium]|nr:hypothetical protein [Acidimicrobiales bacterium]
MSEPNSGEFSNTGHSKRFDTVRRPSFKRFANRYGPFAVVGIALALTVGLAPTTVANNSSTATSIGQSIDTVNAPSTNPACTKNLDLTTLAACKPNWKGKSNGGATWKGVTSNSINIVAYGSPDSALIASLLGGEGPGHLIGTPAEEAHTLEVYGKWFNENFQTYGRTVKFISYNSQGTLTNSSSSSQADAVAIDKQDHAFLTIGGALDEGFFTQLAREQIISIAGAQLPESFYKQNAPYIFGMLPTTNTENSFIASFICHQLGPNSKASFGGNNSVPVINGQTRKYGIIYPTTNSDGSPSIYTGIAGNMASQLRSTCGIKVPSQDEVGYALDPTSAISQVQADSTRLKQDKITTVICLCDPISPTLSAGQMAGQGYFPEFVETGYLLQDYYGLDQLYNQQEWAHVFGISSLPVSASPQDSLYWQVYHSIDPSTDPTPDAQLIFFELLLAFAGIQGAGPNLNPQSFSQSMFNNVRITSNSPSVPTFFYSPRDYGGIKDAQMVWWDPNAIAPNGKLGDFRSVDGGYRFTPSDWPNIPATTLFDNPACLPAGSCGLPAYPPPEISTTTSTPLVPAGG